MAGTFSRRTRGSGRR
ncbi:MULTISPECIES: hypothetical protein [unclassified Salinibacterium]